MKGHHRGPDGEPGPVADAEALAARLRAREEEIARLNQELDETNRGVVALYAELDEQAERLRRADGLKSRFLSHMSHEFRTPVNAVLGLSRILLARTDGELTGEQEKQVTLIQKAAASLLELSNDILDLAKVEAGRVEVVPTTFQVADLFGALRGMFRPLLTNPSVILLFEEAEGLPPLRTDEGKVAQILRNFVSNALKFTEKGEVRVSARRGADGRSIAFDVRDTGVGIAAEDQERLFVEWSQVANPLQGRVKGTGLGLSLSKKLAQLLGGGVSVSSRSGEGSTFTLVIPAEYTADAPPEASPAPPAAVGRRVLVIDDQESDRYIVNRLLRAAGEDVIEAATGIEGLRRARDDRPDLIVLDLVLPGMDGFEILQRLKHDPPTAGIPVVVVSSQDGAREDPRLALAAAVLSKEPPDRERLVDVVQGLLRSRTAGGPAGRG